VFWSFLRNSQRVFSRSAIIDRLWGADIDPPEENTIKSHIKSLRQKLKAAGAPYNFIETVYGLGYRLKALSEEQNGQETPEEPNSLKHQTLSVAIAKAQEEFKARVGSRIVILEQAVNALREGKLGIQLQNLAEQEAHKLAGSLGSFGFAKGSQLAYKMEHLLGGGILVDQSQSLRLSKLVMKLQHELEQTPSEQISPQQQQDVLVLLSDDRQFVEELVKEATVRGMQVKIVKNITSARSAIDNLQTHHNLSLLLDLTCHPNLQDNFKLIAELSNRTPPIPVIVFTDQSHFTNRLEVARAGGHGFLHKSTPKNLVFQQVNQVLQRLSSVEAKVMVVDDDQEVLTVVQKLLEPWGFKLTTLGDPRHFWDILTEFSPDVLILDAKMPDINGIELCQVVRNDPFWSKLPVLFLTAYTTEINTVERIFAAGADDCVSKPVMGEQLVTRILNRLQRS
jgi:DNA-binding response OmpR family regulator